MQSDADIIDASCTDPEQFALIFDRHFDAMYRYLASRVGPELADDLAADSFTVAFRRRLDYDPSRSDARPWLYGIATNLLRRHHRSEQRRLRACARSAAGADDIDTEAVIARADAAAQKAALAHALAALSPADRDVLLLVAGAELSYLDVASALNIPIGTVRSRLNRARGVVRELLAGCGQHQREHRALRRPAKEVLDG